MPDPPLPPGEALSRGAGQPGRRPYGRHAVDVLGAIPPAENIPTYYGQRSLKPSDWRWLIITYLFVGGMAGAAQVIAGVVDLLGHRRDWPLVSAGRYLALTGALISPLLLIADLKTRSRWFNMLRVYRSTSPMSIGSWTLFAFGLTSGLASLGHLLSDLLGLAWGRRLARLIGIPAAVLGAVLSTYTGSLLAATSTPLWSAGYRLLPAIFGASGTTTAIAALSLILQRVPGSDASRHRLERLSLIASVVELLLSRRLDQVWHAHQLSDPLEQPPLVLPYKVGAQGLGILTPLAVHLLQLLTRRELKTLSTVASVSALVGGYSERAVLILAGKQSAERPEDAFRLAQP